MDSQEKSGPCWSCGSEAMHTNQYGEFECNYCREYYDKHPTFPTHYDLYGKKKEDSGKQAK